MEDDQSKQLQQLQSSLDELSSRFDLLTSRLDAIERQETRVSIQSPTPPRVTAPPKKPAFQASQPTSSTNHPNDIIAQRQARLNVAMQPAKRPTISKPAPPTFDMKKLEWFLGVRGLAIVGMLIIVISVGSFLKLAVDEGWVAAISPATRCIASAIFGILLVAVGELFRRKINPLASSGVSAAGIAVIYAAILASTKLYTLLDTPIAFTLLVLVTVTGIFLGSLSNRVMLAILSLIGAFAVPVLLATGEPSFVVLPAYLVSLLVLGLALSAWRGGSYARVRQLAWWGTGLIGTFWLKDMYSIAPTSSITFVSFVWLATVAELIASSRFFSTIRDRTKWPETSIAGFLISETGEKTFDPRQLFAPEARWINALFGVTAWSVTATAKTLAEINPTLDFIAPLGFAVLSIAIVFFIIIQKRDATSRLWAQSASPRSSLAAAMTINAALLSVATIATALGGWIQVVAWATVGLAAIETAKRIRFRAAGLFGFAMLAVAIARLLTYDFIVHLDSNPISTIAGLGITEWTPQIIFIATVCATAAWRSRYRPEAAVAASITLWLLAASLVHASTTGASLGAAALVLAAIAAWISTRLTIHALRINIYILSSVAMGILLFGQLNYNTSQVDLMALQIKPVSMIIAGICWVALAALPKALYQTRFIFAALAITSGMIALAKLADTHGQPEALFATSIYIALIVAISKQFYRWSLIELSGILLYIIAGAWAVRQLTLSDQVFDGQAILNFDFGSALITVAAAIWAGLRLTKLPKPDDAPETLTESRSKISAAVFGLAWALLLTSTSIEIVRVMKIVTDQGSAGGAAVSIWWSLFAIASVVIGFRVKPALRWAGLALLGAVAIKVLLIDTVTLSRGTRIIASVTVGLVIIAAGVLYARLVEVTNEKPEDPDSNPDPEIETDPEPDSDSDSEQPTP